MEDLKESWPKIGDWVYYRGWAAEVIYVPPRPGNSYIIEATDHGGITRSFSVRVWQITPAVFPEENLLDVLERVVPGPVTINSSPDSVAELWLADPQVGDVFEDPGDYRFTIVERLRDGALVVRTEAAVGPPVFWTGKLRTFAGARELRKTLGCSDKPGYWVHAVATQRPEWAQKYPDLGRGK